MQSGTSVSPTSTGLRSDIAKRLLKPIARLLQSGDPAATVDRLFSPQDAEDLRVIIAVGPIGVLLVFVPVHMSLPR